AHIIVIDAEHADIRPSRRQPVELGQLVQTGSTPLCPVVDHHPVALQLGPGHGFAFVIAPLLTAAAGQPERCNHQRYPQPLSHAPSPSAFAWPSSASQLRRLPSSTCRRQSSSRCSASRSGGYQCSCCPSVTGNCATGGTASGRLPNSSARVICPGSRH